MEVKVKPIDRRFWERVLKREYAFCDIKERKGVAYLIKIKEVTSPMIRIRSGEKVILADNDYYWLEIALENENFWLTAMFDPQGELIQYYFDITRKNVIDGENSYFEDLFLDIVVQKNRNILILDEDELAAALEEKVITKEEFDFANSYSKEVIDSITNNCDEYDNLTRQYFNILREKIENKNN